MKIRFPCVIFLHPFFIEWKCVSIFILGTEKQIYTMGFHCICIQQNHNSILIREYNNYIIMKSWFYYTFYSIESQFSQTDNSKINKLAP